MANLILQCGARHVERRTIAQADTPTATPSWVPIPHIRLLELADMRGQQDERIRSYKETEVTDPVAHDLVIRSVDANVLPVTQAPAVLEEWRHPSHEEFTADGKPTTHYVCLSAE